MGDKRPDVTPEVDQAPKNPLAEPALPAEEKPKEQGSAPGGGAGSDGPSNSTPAAALTRLEVASIAAMQGLLSSARVVSNLEQEAKLKPLSFEEVLAGKAVSIAKALLKEIDK